MKTFILILLMLLLVPSVGKPQDCIDYSEYLHWAGGVDTPGSARAVTIVENFAYVADGEAGLQVVDIFVPESPVIVAAVETPGFAGGVAVAGNYAYVADGYSGLQVIDISFPDFPATAGAVDMPDLAGGVAVSGNYAFVANGYSGLQVIDISMPEFPVIVGAANTPGFAGDVAVSGNYAYVADGYSGLQMIDISVPEFSALVGGVSTPDFANCVAISGSYAYVADGGSGLQVIDITNTAGIQIVGVDTPGYASGVAVVGDYAYVADGSSGLQVIDISLPEYPAIVVSAYTPDFAGHVAVAGNYAFMTEGDYGLQVIDLTNIPPLPPSPVVGSVDTPSRVDKLAVFGDYAYAAGLSELHIIDVSEPASPAVVGELGPPSYGTYRDVAVSGDHVYLTMGWPSVLLAVGVSLPDSPQVVGTIEMWGEAHGVDIESHFAYVASGTSGLQVVDISNPEFLVHSSNFLTMGAARQVAVAGEFAYAALGDGHGFNGLEVIDVSDPSWPNHMGVVETPDIPRDAVVADNHVYAVFGEQGLRIIDVSDPTMPSIVGSWQAGSVATGVTVFGAHAYVSVADGTWYVIDVSVPSSPTNLGSVWQSESVRDIVCAGDFVYVARDQIGLQIAWPQCGQVGAVDESGGVMPGASLSLLAYPNPFNPQTTISFYLDRSGWAEIGVYELSGRRVTLLADRTLTAGTHSVIWNGRDSLGRTLPSGTYLVCIQTESRMESSKVVLIK